MFVQTAAGEWTLTTEMLKNQSETQINFLSAEIEIERVSRQGEKSCSDLRNCQVLNIYGLDWLDKNQVNILQRESQTRLG